MKSPTPPKSPSLEAKQAEAALIQASQRAWELSVRTGTPFIIYHNNRIIDLNDPPKPLGTPKPILKD